MTNTKKFDFSQRFMIGSGTATRATLDTIEDVDEYLAAQSDLDRHFCKIYDREKHQYTDGFNYAGKRYGRPVEWWPW